MPSKLNLNFVSYEYIDIENLVGDAELEDNLIIFYAGNFLCLLLVISIDRFLYFLILWAIIALISVAR